uniref:Proton_antipo_M domain-containing protein n=1 Tax=Steinernema glaseri TaxID=37863 RepID=A0A1I8ADU4_9BILA
MGSLGPTQMCLIYGAFVLLVYIETDGFMVDAPMLSAVPVVVLGLMTLTVNMSAKPKLLTTLYFLVSAHGVYKMSTSRFHMEWSALELGLANIFYFLSFVSLLRRVWIHLTILTSIYLVGFAYFCFADLFPSIPLLVVMLTFGATVISVSMVCAGSVWRYSAQFTDARQASLMRFAGLMLNLTCTSAFLFSQFATRKHQMVWFMKVAHYVAQLFLCLANERTF